MSLGELRQKIDKIDSELLDLFQQRMDIVEEVALYKTENNMQVLHPERESEILDKRSEQAREKYKQDVRALFTELMRLSRNMQEKIIETKKRDA